MKRKKKRRRKRRKRRRRRRTRRRRRRRRKRIKKCMARDLASGTPRVHAADNSSHCSPSSDI